MFGACLLTLLLIIGAPGSDQPTTFDNPRLYGECAIHGMTLSIAIPLNGHELIMEKGFDIFRVELPKKPGYYELQYVFPHEFAELWPKGQVIVKRGPKGMY
jgi:hypothetical protein